MEKLNFKLETFEGPLDLLLYLISKHKLDIYDIEISKLVDQYMEYINAMKSENLEIASEFLEMAARLVYMKTVALLPKHEEVQALKNELTGELLEYASVRAAADRLKERCLYGSIFEKKPDPIPVNTQYTRKHSADELILAYGAIMGKSKRRLPPPISSFNEIVIKPVVSVESKVISILKKLYKSKSLEFSRFYESSNRSELVATFLAMLELVKEKRIRISDDNKMVYFNRENA